LKNVSVHEVSYSSNGYFETLILTVI